MFFKDEVVILLLRQVYALMISDWIGEKLANISQPKTKIYQK